jgi:hypothetical protein
VQGIKGLRNLGTINTINYSGLSLTHSAYSQLAEKKVRILYLDERIIFFKHPTN